MSIFDDSCIPEPLFGPSVVVHAASGKHKGCNQYKHKCGKPDPVRTPQKKPLTKKPLPDDNEKWISDTARRNARKEKGQWDDSAEIEDAEDYAKDAEAQFNTEGKRLLDEIDKTYDELSEIDMEKKRRVENGENEAAINAEYQEEYDKLEDKVAEMQFNYEKLELTAQGARARVNVLRAGAEQMSTHARVDEIRRFVSGFPNNKEMMAVLDKEVASADKEFKRMTSIADDIAYKLDRLKSEYKYEKEYNERKRQKNAQHYD